MSSRFSGIYRILAGLVTAAILISGCAQATPTAAPVVEPAQATSAPQPTTPPAEPTKPPAPAEIKIGAGLQLSGWAVGDTELAHTLDYQMWVDQLNAQGGIYVKDYDKRIPVKLIVYDTESDIGKTVRMYEKLILEDKVDILLPPWATAFSFAVAPLVEQYKYPLIGTTEGSSQLREALRAGDFTYYFALWNPADVVGKAVVDMVKDVGVKSAAVIFVGTLYGIDQSAVITPMLGREGIDVKLIESYPLGVTDLSPLLKKIKDLNPDAILAISYPADAMLIQEQLMVIDFSPKLFYNSLSGYPAQLDKFGAAACEGMISEGAWNKNWSTPGTKEFYDEFTKRFNREPAWDSAITWASLQMWEQVLREVGLDREMQREYIASTLFDTIDGKVKFTSGENRFTGDANGANPPILGQWQKGVFEVVWPKDIQSAPLIFPKPAWAK